MALGILGKALAGAGGGVKDASLEAMRAEIMRERDERLNQYQTQMQTNVVQPFQREQQESQQQFQAGQQKEVIASHEKISANTLASHRELANLSKTISSDAEGRLFYLDNGKKPVFLTDPETGQPIKGPKDNGLTKAIVESYTSEISAVAKDQGLQEDQRRAQINSLRTEMLNTLKNPADFGKNTSNAQPAPVADIAAIWRGGGKSPAGNAATPAPSAPAAPASAAPAQSDRDRLTYIEQQLGSPQMSLMEGGLIAQAKSGRKFMGYAEKRALEQERDALRKKLGD